MVMLFLRVLLVLRVKMVLCFSGEILGGVGWMVMMVVFFGVGMRMLVLVLC